MFFCDRFYSVRAVGALNKFYLHQMSLDGLSRVQYRYSFRVFGNICLKLFRFSKIIIIVFNSGTLEVIKLEIILMAHFMCMIARKLLWCRGIDTTFSVGVSDMINVIGCNLISMIIIVRNFRNISGEEAG
jgi:hypothetical protein